MKLIKILIPALAVVVLVTSCSNTEDTGPEANSPSVSENANLDSPGVNTGSPSPEVSDLGGRNVDTKRDGWQVIVPLPEEREYVRERVFSWPGGSGEMVDVLSSESAVDKEYKLVSKDPRVREPHFDGPFRIEMMAELTADGTVFGYFLWLRGVGADSGADPEKAAARNRLYTLRIFDYEGKGKFEPLKGGGLRVPNWVSDSK